MMGVVGEKEPVSEHDLYPTGFPEFMIICLIQDAVRLVSEEGGLGEPGDFLFDDKGDFFPFIHRIDPLP